MSLNTFVYCLLVAFIFWVATLGDKAKAQQSKAPLGGVPSGAAPAMAGGAPRPDEKIESGILENHK